MAAHRLVRISLWQSPRAAFKACHIRILGLCSELEEFADALPNRLEPARCRRLARALLPVLRECHRSEELTVERISRARHPDLAESIGRLRDEHRRDRCFAEEIAEALDRVSDIEPLKNPEALGFMLRSFFEAQRRHIAFEQERILPALALHAKTASH